TAAPCAGSACRTVEKCLIDECEAKIEYEFEGEEYKSMCTFGPMLTTTLFPLDGGSGSAQVERDLQECFYKVDVEFNDVDQARRCTVVRDCTVQELSCGPSAPGKPNCQVVDQTPCPQPTSPRP